MHAHVSLASIRGGPSFDAASMSCNTVSFPTADFTVVSECIENCERALLRGVCRLLRGVRV